jgi:NDP-sugar pyrophosphorylase family protein
MQALILAGGRGTRLAPFTVSFPKPLVPVGERPILHHLVDQLRDAGCNEIVLSVNHLASLVEAYFGDGRNFGLPIRYAREQTPLGTAGPLGVTTGLAEHFLVLNGDILTDVDFAALYRDHCASGAVATIVTFRRDVAVTLGVVVDDGNGRLAEYREKPTLSFEVSTGIYALSREVVSSVPPGRPMDMPDLMRALVDQGRSPRLYRHSGRWLDIGRAEDYQLAQELWARKEGR